MVVTWYCWGRGRLNDWNRIMIVLQKAQSESRNNGIHSVYPAFDDMVILWLRLGALHWFWRSSNVRPTSGPLPGILETWGNTLHSNVTTRSRASLNAGFEQVAKNGIYLGNSRSFEHFWNYRAVVDLEQCSKTKCAIRKIVLVILYSGLRSLSILFILCRMNIFNLTPPIQALRFHLCKN